MWESVVQVAIGGLLAGGLFGALGTRFLIYHFRVRRLTYERDCYRTALHVLELNGYFDHKAEELVRQHTPE